MAASQVQRDITYYNLDVIISVGYRVKPQQGTRFRQWATGVLRDHLTQGYSLNRQRLEQNAATLEAALTLVKKAADDDAPATDQGRGLVDVIARYTPTFLWLQRHHQRNRSASGRGHSNWQSTACLTGIPSPPPPPWRDQPEYRTRRYQ